VTFNVGGSLCAVQCEAGDTASSPIATPASGPASRPAEIVPATDASWLGPTVNSILVEAHLPGVPADGIRRLFSLDDGSDANRHDLHFLGAQNRMLLFTKAGGTSQGNIDGLLAGWIPGTIHRFAIRVGGGARAFFVDGAKAGEDAIADPVGATRVHIARNWSGAPWGGHVRRVLAYPRALSDAELTALTA
jgi:hypothetical protein